MKKIFFAILFGTYSLYSKPIVTVSIVPQKFFVQKIAANTVDINIMVKPGNSPTTYEPKPKQMVALDKSDAYFAIGVPFERTWLPKFTKTYPKLTVVHTQKGIKLREMKGHHHHKAETQDKHKIMDPHIWLDPLHVKTMSQSITKTLINLYPQNKALYKENLDKFSKEIDSIHKMIQEKLATTTKNKFMVFHPSWGYFAKRYGLQQEAIEIEGKEPKPSNLTKLIKEARKEDIHLIIVQPQFSQKSAKIIAKEIDGEVRSLNQLAYEWDKEILKTADLLSKTLK